MGRRRRNVRKKEGGFKCWGRKLSIWKETNSALKKKVSKGWGAVIARKEEYGTKQGGGLLLGGEKKIE